MNINEAFPSKWLKAADIKGRPPVAVVISNITMEEVGDDNGLKPVVYFQGKEKGVVLNKTNGAMIANTYGPETDGWIGKTILLRCEAVPFKGQIVDSIRVSAAQVAAVGGISSQLEVAPDNFQPDVPEGDFDDDIAF